MALGWKSCFVCWGDDQDLDDPDNHDNAVLFNFLRLGNLAFLWQEFQQSESVEWRVTKSLGHIATQSITVTWCGLPTFLICDLLKLYSEPLEYFNELIPTKEIFLLRIIHRELKRLNCLVTHKKAKSRERKQFSIISNVFFLHIYPFMGICRAWNVLENTEFCFLKKVLRRCYKVFNSQKFSIYFLLSAEGFNVFVSYCGLSKDVVQL